jgi:hypothetical protein
MTLNNKNTKKSENSDEEYLKNNRQPHKKRIIKFTVVCFLVMAICAGIYFGWLGVLFIGLDNITLSTAQLINNVLLKGCSFVGCMAFLLLIIPLVDTISYIKIYFGKKYK